MVRFRGKFICQLIIDRRMPVHDLRGDRGPVIGSRYTTIIIDIKM